jgi:isopenicillin-N epimerase
MNHEWREARAAMMLDPDVTYLNTGSYGIPARAVFERVTALRESMTRNPVDFLWRRQGPELLWQSRERLARFLNVEPRRLVFTQNVSASINVVAASLCLASPGEVLLTDHEYGAMRFVWERAAQRQGLTLRTVQLPEPAPDARQLIDVITSAFRPATRVLQISQIFYTTGTIAPLREICEEARRRGILTVVDGAHAPGMIALDLPELQCDFYGANLHKWFCAPVGAGFLYAAPGQEDRLQPLNVSWGWRYDRARPDERDEFGGTPRLRSFEFEGSRDITPWLVVPECIELIERIGLSAIKQRHRSLSDHVRRRLGEIPTMRQATADDSQLRGGITAYRLGPVNLPLLRRILHEENRIEVNVIEALPGNYLRVSTHYYNEEAEVDRLATVLPEALARARQ